MPFHTNNVDLSVSANFLYGTAHAALQSLNNGAAKKAFMTNNAIQKLFADTANLVAWGVKSGAAITRPVRIFHAQHFPFFPSNNNFLFSYFENIIGYIFVVLSFHL